jgi:hypothetical protein
MSLSGSPLQPGPGDIGTIHRHWRPVPPVPGAAPSFPMFPRLIAAWPLEGHQLWLTFADGTEGPLDLAAEAPDTVLEPLRDLDLFRAATVDRAGRRLLWPNAVSLDGEALYRALRRRQRHRLNDSRRPGWR